MLVCRKDHRNCRHRSPVCGEFRAHEALKRLTPVVMGSSRSFEIQGLENLSGNHVLSVYLNLLRIKCFVMTSFVKSLATLANSH